MNNRKIKILKYAALGISLGGGLSSVLASLDAAAFSTERYLALSTLPRKSAQNDSMFFLDRNGDDFKIGVSWIKKAVGKKEVKENGISNSDLEGVVSQINTLFGGDAKPKGNAARERVEKIVKGTVEGRDTSIQLAIVTQTDQEKIVGKEVLRLVGAKKQFDYDVINDSLSKIANAILEWAVQRQVMNIHQQEINKLNSSSSRSDPLPVSPFIPSGHEPVVGSSTDQSREFRPQNRAQLQGLGTRINKLRAELVKQGIISDADQPLNVAGLINGLDQMEKEIPGSFAKLTREKDELTNKLNSQKASLEDSQRQHTELEGRINGLRAELVKQGIISDADQPQNVIGLINGLNQMEKEIPESFAKLTREKNELTNKLNSQKASLEASQRRHIELEGRINGLQTKITELENEKARLNEGVFRRLWRWFSGN
jgi:DNA repair exonuclease SbcCD ATPase subunit